MLRRDTTHEDGGWSAHPHSRSQNLSAGEQAVALQTTVVGQVAKTSVRHASRLVCCLGWIAQRLRPSSSLSIAPAAMPAFNDLYASRIIAGGWRLLTSRSCNEHPRR